MRQHTDNQRSIQLYREHAASYDQSARFTMPLRRRAIALLNLRPGDVVLDVGAGTGLSFELLREAVGTSGRVLAFEQSPDMFTLASARVARHGWQNVWLMHTAAEIVELPGIATPWTTRICCSRPRVVASIGWANCSTANCCKPWKPSTKRSGSQRQLELRSQ